jgi:hypothetical protein
LTLRRPSAQDADSGADGSIVADWNPSNDLERPVLLSASDMSETWNAMDRHVRCSSPRSRLHASSVAAWPTLICRA